MSVELFATFGLMLMKRLATCPPSKTQSTVSPPKTVAIFSSTGSRISVDCKRPARIYRWRRRFGDRDRARSARLKVVRSRGGEARGGRAEGKSTRDKDENGWLHDESFRLRVDGVSDSLALGESGDAFCKSVLFDQLRPPDSILWLGRERCIASVVEIESDNLRKAIAPHIQSFAILQALEESDLLLVHLEELCVSLAVEGCVLEKQERSAGVDDAVGVRSEVVGGLANHGDAAKVLANRLDGGKRSFEQLLVLHRGEDLFDQDVLRYAEIGRVIEHIVDPAKKPDHQWFDQVGILLVVHSLEVKALDARE